MNGFIYKISNNINNKVYIGKTLLDINKRFKEHCKDSLRERCEKRPLYNAMQKYGSQNFEITLIGEYPIEELSNQEIYWIEYFNSYHNGYNATLGGDGKQLYDYDKFVVKYSNGELIKDIANDFECSTDIISQALKLSGIDTFKNAIDKSKKGIVAKNKKGEIIKSFSSRTEAVIWLEEIKKINSSVRKDNVIASIGRVANGQRKSAYGYLWENL